MRIFPQEYVELLEALFKTSTTTAYDSFTMSLHQLDTIGISMGYRTKSWTKMTLTMMDTDDSVDISKVAEDYAFKVDKKNIAAFLQRAKMFRAATLLEDDKSYRNAA
jgi:hypothetical protein